MLLLILIGSALVLSGCQGGGSGTLPIPPVIIPPVLEAIGYLVIQTGSTAAYWGAVDWERRLVDPIHRMLGAIGTKGGGKLRLGVLVHIHYLDSAVEDVLAQIDKLFEIALRLDCPVMIDLADVTWWQHRSDLWNWFDPLQPGYNPENIRNVEWESFDPSSASRNSWRNWGGVGEGFWLGCPAPNFEAPGVRAAVQERLQRVVPRIVQHLQALKNEGKEYLLAGVKLGWECAIGAGTAPDQAHIDAEDTGYGYRAYLDHRGLPNGKDAVKPADFHAVLVNVVKRWLEFLAKTAVDAGLQRALVYVHAATTWEHETLSYVPAAFNDHSWPTWSYYPPWRNLSEIAQRLKEHGFPLWGVGEGYLFAAPNDYKAWTDYLTSLFRNPSAPNGRMTALYTWAGLEDKPEAIRAIRDFLAPPGVTRPVSTDLVSHRTGT